MTASRRTWLSLIQLVGAFVVAGAVWAESIEPMDSDVFGLNTNLLYVSAEEFTCSDETGVGGECEYVEEGYGFWGVSSSNPKNLYAPVNLPTGALVTGMLVLYYDNTETLDLSGYLIRYWQQNANRGANYLASFASSGTPGVTNQYVDISPDFTIAYRVGSVIAGYVYQSYVLQVYLPSNAPLTLRGIGIHWQRQVSAAPGTATFNDVGTGHWAFRHIEALAASGVTSGCGGGSYCPNANVTRAEMAVFLAKALGLHYGP